jgi:hypothetical protein
VKWELICPAAPMLLAPTNNLHSNSRGNAEPNPFSKFHDGYFKNRLDLQLPYCASWALVFGFI